MSVLAYMGYYYYDVTYLLVILGAVLSMIASAQVNSTFKRYSRVRSSCGMTGAEAAERILYRNGLTNVRIEHISGNLTDHYDPSSKVLRLSDATYNATSVAAVGVAAHECGHAVQDARGYAPLKFRSALVPAANFGSKFGLPIFTFVDTPGAFPGIDAEERGQSEAIGRNLFVMADLKVPIIATIIGEGGSGGALAIAVADTVQMLQYSVYSVISPEGCASILWKTAERANEAAEALGLTAQRLKEIGMIDKIIDEPLGGAHRDMKGMAAVLKRALAESYRQLENIPLPELLAARREKWLNYGKFRDTAQSE